MCVRCVCCAFRKIPPGTFPPVFFLRFPPTVIVFHKKNISTRGGKSEDIRYYGTSCSIRNKTIQISACSSIDPHQRTNIHIQQYLNTPLRCQGWFLDAMHPFSSRMLHSAVSHQQRCHGEKSAFPLPHLLLLSSASTACAPRLCLRQRPAPQE